MLQDMLTIITLLSTAFTIIILCLPKQYGVFAAPLATRPTGQQGRDKDNASFVQILVLGDIGRSPRMQYHALSFAQHGASVQLIGYLETKPLPEILALSNVTIVPLATFPKVLQSSNKLMFLVLAPAKVLFQMCNLWWVLGYRTTATKFLMVQNPPSIPTLMLAAIICFLRRTRLVIDWHNFGYSILALKLGESHPFVRVSKLYEKLLARTAHGHFAVTDVMAKLLQQEYVKSAPVLTLHDRPAKIFQPLSSSDRIAFLTQHPLTSSKCDALLKKSCRLVVSSTSWTPDEDFSVLLDALCRYCSHAEASQGRLPGLFVIITGKGPQKEHYLQQINMLQNGGKLATVSIQTAWLSFEDYACLLGAADLGVSLHTSSSGVDLPMKVVDMFGSALPVLGFDNFKAWPELVTEGVNGRGFKNAPEMAIILQELFDPDSTQLALLKEGALVESSRRWDAEWNSVAGKFFGLLT